MVAKRWRNAAGQRIRVAGGPRAKDETCCGCDCTDFAFCIFCGSVVTKTVNATLSFPTGVTEASIICIGKGGDGGTSTLADTGAGGGGGGGSATLKTIDNSGGNLSITVNNASNSYAAEVKQSGSTICIGYAGTDGADSDIFGPGTGGAGGSGSADYSYIGGTGADGINKDGTVEGYGGGGGGGAGSVAAGGDGIDYVAGIGGTKRGGDGGGGGDNTVIDGDNGNTYGGGGGGGYDLGVGGVGANGQVRVIWHELGKLHITVSGSNHYEGVCECVPAEGGYTNTERIFNWDALNGSFTLTQDSASSITFTKEWSSTNRDELQAGGVNVYNEYLTVCEGYEDLSIGYETEIEWYLSAMYARVGCTAGAGGGMYIANWGFSIIQCSRSRYWTGSAWTDWDAWYCEGILVDSSLIPLCDVSPVTQYAQVCSTDTMITTLEWVDFIDQIDQPCNPLYGCVPGYTHTGQISGYLSCALDVLATEDWTGVDDETDLVLNEEELYLLTE